MGQHDALGLPRRSRREDQGGDPIALARRFHSRSRDTRLDQHILEGNQLAAQGAGANRLNGISFGVANDGELLEAARKLAVAEARAKAETYAAAAGVKLGVILSIDEGGGGFQPQPRAAMRMAAEAMPIEAGETVVGAGVRIVWALEE